MMGAFYSNTIERFINDDNDLIIGSLTKQAGIAGFHQQLHTQTLSWDEEITVLKSSLKELTIQEPSTTEFGILLEYPIARREKRIDVVIITDNLIIVIEFKVGKDSYLNTDKEQLLDYCLDLRDFHFESRGKIIIPILLATKGDFIEYKLSKNEDLVKDIVFSSSDNLTHSLLKILNQYTGEKSELDFNKWNVSDYSPTPTIIEAAQTLYAGKSVIEISRSHAGTKNLTKTSDAVVDAIKIAKANNQKIICFITGVPGAGKTLAGLNIAHDEEFQGHEKSLATFLSGNGPLIKVLREALSRDAFKKIKRDDKNAKKKETDRIISFIENVHRFLDHYFFEKERIPNNKIVIFDEAQRAWNAEHSMRKFQRPHSEPEMMFEIMSRHKDWSVIVALVGGGQEINTGEAGLPEWGRIIQEKFNDWKV
jgi:Holliday junction resolvase